MPHGGPAKITGKVDFAHVFGNEKLETTLSRLTKKLIVFGMPL